MVLRLSGREHGVRVAPGGPREVRLIGAALNNLAEGQERGRAVEEQVRSELLALDKAKEDFVSNVSHELRTPLTTISGYLEMVEDEFDGRLDERHQKMLDAGHRNVDRLRVLVDDLLTLSTAENRTTDLERIDLASLVHDVVADLRLTAGRRGIDLEVRVGEENLLVLADRLQLSRALVNLVSNAVKFSQPDSAVELTLSPVDGMAQLVVRDQGIGIPADELDQLGQRFFRASNAVAEEIQGTGLGLRIVQAIITNHQGDLGVDSVEGEGTAVTVRLPLQADGDGE